MKFPDEEQLLFMFNLSCFGNFRHIFFIPFNSSFENKATIRHRRALRSLILCVDLAVGGLPTLTAHTEIGD